jgi:hypothetical protein
MVSLKETLLMQQEEAERFYRLTEGWPPEERIRVLIGWMGIEALRRCNAHLMKEQPNKLGD